MVNTIWVFNIIIIIINALFWLIQIHIKKDIYSLQESGA